jgi:hypothetical protein
MSNKLAAVVLAMLVLVGAMGLKTVATAHHSDGAVFMAAGSAPTPPPPYRAGSAPTPPPPYRAGSAPTPPPPYRSGISIPSAQ